MNDLIIGLITGSIIFGIISAIIYFLLKKEITAIKEAKNKEQELETKVLSDLKHDLTQRENRLNQKEDKLDNRKSDLDSKQSDIQSQEKDIIKKLSNLDKKKSDIQQTENSLNKKLEDIANLTEKEARDKLVKDVETRYSEDLMQVAEKKKKNVEAKKKEISKEIIINAIQQYSWDVTIETTQSTVQIPSEDFKWRLIWKEWRNIIAFERASGVSLIIDDTPDSVFISSFDLFRRYIAKKSLEQLLEDKRIQPARIEEIVEENENNAKELIYNLWNKTLNDVWITDFPDEIISLVWKLRFRTSYGQNILKHSLEVWYIAEAIAKQIGADQKLALKWWILHDIWKALDHDIEWTHPEIGWKLWRQYNLDDKLVNIIEGHHDWVPQICIETKIVQIADAISAVRPWARRASVEQYLKRIKEMENLAASFSGVDKAFALSAGREVRVFVDAKTVSDIDAQNLAKKIADDIQDKLSYPGEVKVNLVRETRVIEYAK